jgi:predicted  nucleic acid-binding Zn-ribbon protein
VQAMDTSSQQAEPVQYQSPRRVQVWFLSRSRRLWKQKYQELKHEAKRLRHRVADVTKSREKWRTEVEQLRQQVRRCEEELATLKARPMQAEAKKKSAARPVGTVG